MKKHILIIDDEEHLADAGHAQEESETPHHLDLRTLFFDEDDPSSPVARAVQERRAVSLATAVEAGATDRRLIHLFGAGTVMAVPLLALASLLLASWKRPPGPPPGAAGGDERSEVSRSGEPD